MATAPRTENDRRSRDQSRADKQTRALNLVERWRVLTRAHVEMRTGFRPLEQNDWAPKSPGGHPIEHATEPICAFLEKIPLNSAPARLHHGSMLPY